MNNDTFEENAMTLVDYNNTLGSIFVNYGPMRFAIDNITRGEWLDMDFLELCHAYRIWGRIFQSVIPYTGQFDELWQEIDACDDAKERLSDSRNPQTVIEKLRDVWILHKFSQRGAFVGFVGFEEDDYDDSSEVDSEIGELDERVHYSNECIKIRYR
jgi:hypothetical protein